MRGHISKYIGNSPLWKGSLKKESAHPTVGFCLYVEDIGKYLTDSGIYTDEELDRFDILEKEWRDSLPIFTFSNILAWFPEGRNLLKKRIKAEIADSKEKIYALTEDGEHYRKNVIEKAPPFDQRVLTDGLNDRTEYWHKVYDKQIRKLKAQLLSIKIVEGKKEPPKTGITDDMIERARQVPITSLVKVNRGRFGLCPFHGDRHPSFHVYRDNHAFCFSCKKRADAIDIAQILHGLDFKQAVEWLCKL